MKKIIVIIVFLFVLKPVFPVLEYTIHYDYIAKELCENKAKPEMKCNGKCHLMKELAKASDSENPTPQDKKASHQEFEVLFFEKFTTVALFHLNFPVQKVTGFNYSNLYSHQASTAVFHPPVV